MAEHFSFGSWDIKPVPSSNFARMLARAVPSSAVACPRSASVILQFDSIATPVSGVRGLSSRRHCVYGLGTGDAVSPTLEVLVERRGQRDGWSVLGQVFQASGEGWAGCAIELRDARAGAMSHTARTNAMGEFALMPAGNGPWRLGVVAGGKRYDIAPVQMP
jgi:hypothetical protein